MTDNSDEFEFEKELDIEVDGTRSTISSAEP
jgi:hypothetical protein